MTAVRDTLCNLRPMEIPRPKCAGFQFVPTRGRMGFYMSIKRDGEKYGIQLKNQGPRRPSLPDPRLWGLSQPVTHQHLSNVQLYGTLNNNKNHPRSSLVSSEDLLKAQVTSSQVIIPEEPEEFNEPVPDYENNPILKTVAVPTKNAPPAPPLPPSLLLNLRRSSLDGFPKVVTKRQIVSKKNYKYEYLIEEDEGEDEVLKL